MRVDLNADVGESPGDAGDVLLAAVTSVNIAAGFHAGDPSLLRDTLRRAQAHGTAIGAHPSFADREGFGRREVKLNPREAEDLVLYQIAAVGGIAAAEGIHLRHVKPHGALYNMAAGDRQLAEAVARAVLAYDRTLTLVGPPQSQLLAAGRDAGLSVMAEGFADRAYQRDGSLAARHVSGAVIVDPDTAARRVVRMVKEATVETIDGGELALTVETICVHGDTPDAARLALAVRRALEAEGITVSCEK